MEHTKWKILIAILITQLMAVIYFICINPTLEKNSIAKNLVKWISNGLPRITEDIAKLNQTDPALILFANRFIIPPSQLPYGFPRVGPTGIVMSIFPQLSKLVKNGRNGFFVEAGAYDGVGASNTVWLEREFNWSGLLALVECHPKSLETLIKNHRKAFVAQSCLSPSNHSEMNIMTSVDAWNPASSLGSGDIFSDFKKFSSIEVPTFPLYTLLSAVGVTTVDFISLDVQSLELKILKNFPFDRILVKSWLLEVDLLSESDKNDLLALMDTNGFSFISKVTKGDYFLLHK